MKQIEKRFLKSLIILIYSLTVSGCWNYDTKNTSTGGVEIIDGHTLPPDPGEAGKNTLLGIDSNNDGVRDDLERYLYHRFSKEEYPKTKIAIAMQYGRAVQKILENPGQAYENKTYQYLDNASDCKWYFYLKYKGDNYVEGRKFRKNNPIFDEKFKDIIFNTRERVEAYFIFNKSLSGHAFSSQEKTLDKCDVDIDQFDE